jgi:hypothetical protein
LPTWLQDTGSRSTDGRLGVARRRKSLVGDDTQA